MKIDLQLIKAARPQIEAALKEIGENLNINISLGASSREPDGSSGSFKIKMNEIREDGVSPEEINFRKVCSLYDLQPEDYGKEITIKGDLFTLAGLNTRAPKNPVNIKRVSDGGNFKAGEGVLRQLKLESK
jgi:hypothetical protein